jgi:uncharacterized protein
MEEKIYALLKEKKTDELINEINSNGSLLDFQDKNGASLLLLSAYFRNKELQSFLLSKKKSLTVFEASACGRADVVQQLATEDSSLINAFGNDGFPALGLAAYFGHEEVVKLLLQLGADPNLPAKNSIKVVPLHAAVSAKHLAIAKLLLDHFADVNAKQQKDFTPLHGAAHNGDMEMVTLLLKFGADKNAVTSEGKTPLDLALEMNHASLEKLLS